MYKAYGNRIIVEKEIAPEKSAGGILIPSSSTITPQARGVVKDAIKEELRGKVVVFNEGGTWKDGNTYFLLEENILAIVE